MLAANSALRPSLSKFSYADMNVYISYSIHHARQISLHILYKPRPHPTSPFHPIPIEGTVMMSALSRHRGWVPREHAGVYRIGLVEIDRKFVPG
jgi:hypothetical protein